MLCQFGNSSIGTRTVAYMESATSASCNTPPLDAEMDAGPQELYLVLSNDEFIATSITFVYHETVALHSVTPSTIGEAGEQILTLSGSNFIDTGLLSCRFGHNQLDVRYGSLRRPFRVRRLL